MTIYPFLTFNGNCEEAMRFYQSCFGGRLRFRYLGESPFGRDLPDKMRSLILQASLESEEIRLFASDLGPDEGLYAGNSISLFIKIKAGEKFKSAFRKLASHGEITAPLTQATRKGEWATLTDRYSVHWIFEVD